MAQMNQINYTNSNSEKQTYQRIPMSCRNIQKHQQVQQQVQQVQQIAGAQVQQKEFLNNRAKFMPTSKIQTNFPMKIIIMNYCPINDY